MAWMMERVKAGKVRVVIEKAYPLERVKDALAASEAGRARGKIVVKVI
jgi:NADPH:quinone reductase-like Zn-dependent oxidoreductase